MTSQNERRAEFERNFLDKYKGKDGIDPLLLYGPDGGLFETVSEIISQLGTDAEKELYISLGGCIYFWIKGQVGSFVRSPL